MGMLLNFVILYVATVFGLQHYRWLAAGIGSLVSQTSVNQLEVFSFIFLTLFFLTIAHVIKTKIFANHYMPLSGTFIGGLITIFSFVAIVWFISMIILGIYIHALGINQDNSTVSSTIDQMHYGLRLLAKTGYIFIALVEPWITFREPTLFEHSFIQQ